jgi:hypothetical protein
VVSRHIPNAATQVLSQFKSSGICGGQSDTGAGSSEFFGLFCQFSFHQMLHIHLSYGAGTIGQLVADVPSGLSLTPVQETKKNMVSR